MSKDKSGNKKSSGNSSTRYWQRAQASDYAGVHKRRRIKRHALQMGRDAIRVEDMKIPRGTARSKRREKIRLQYGIPTERQS